MGTQTRTIEQLIAEYARPLADAVGITLDPGDLTPGGFPALLTSVSQRADSQSRDSLEEVAQNLISPEDLKPEALARRLHEADLILWEVLEDLRLCL
jgi:hypothetical protein